MSLTKGSKVEASDWNNLADAYNSEIVDRRKVTNVKITGAQIEQQINSNFTIKWLESLEEKDNKILLGKLDPKLGNTSNSLIQDMFNYDDMVNEINKYDFKVYKYP